jgi:predicted nucleic acid-binding protein
MTRWVVDTCLVLDVLENDARFGAASATLLDAKRAVDGLLLCPVSFVELAPSFDGDLDRQRQFLRRVGIGFDEDWQLLDTLAAHAAWHRVIRRRRAGDGGRRPVADALIGAFACRFQGLLTRNPDDFAPVFPGLRIVTPPSPASRRA